MTSRRELMKLLGMAPVAGVSAAKELAALAASPAVKAAMTIGSVGSSIDMAANPAPSRGFGVFSEALQRKISFLRDVAGEEYHASLRTRINGIDPDLAALRSVSYGYKCRKQADRDRESANFFQRMQRMSWGETMDY